MRKVEPFAAAVAIEPQAKPSSWDDAESSLSDEAPSAPAVDMAALEQALDNPAALDLTAIEQRYPLLRNTF
jgi:hypothetical protein